MQQIIVTRELKALANQRRLTIIKELNRGGPLSVSEIARRLKLSVRSTSKHVQKLAHTDL